MRRHSWGEPKRWPHETLRECTRPGCDVVKVTHHKPRIWTDYIRKANASSLAARLGERAPPCEGER